MALEIDKYAWGLFWAGGGLQHCRELLVKEATASENQSALVPASPDALLRLVLDLQSNSVNQKHKSIPTPIKTTRYQQNNQLKIITYTSVVWFCLLLITIASFNGIIAKQDRMLEILLERTKTTQQ